MNWNKKIMKSSNLEELRDNLNELQLSHRETRDERHDVKTDSLPTFGGKPIDDEVGFFSWDAESVVIYDSCWKIVPRQERQEEDD